MTSSSNRESFVATTNAGPYIGYCDTIRTTSHHHCCSLENRRTSETSVSFFFFWLHAEGSKIPSLVQRFHESGNNLVVPFHSIPIYSIPIYMEIDIWILHLSVIYFYIFLLVWTLYLVFSRSCLSVSLSLYLCPPTPSLSLDQASCLRPGV